MDKYMPGVEETLVFLWHFLWLFLGDHQALRQVALTYTVTWGHCLLFNVWHKQVPFPASLALSFLCCPKNVVLPLWCCRCLPWMCCAGGWGGVGVLGWAGRRHSFLFLSGLPELYLCYCKICQCHNLGLLETVLFSELLQYAKLLIPFPRCAETSVQQILVPLPEKWKKSHFLTALSHSPPHTPPPKITSHTDFCGN